MRSWGGGLLERDRTANTWWRLLENLQIQNVYRIGFEYLKGDRRSDDGHSAVSCRPGRMRLMQLLLVLGAAIAVVHSVDPIRIRKYFTNMFIKTYELEHFT